MSDQKFYQQEADAMFPAGCKCGNNGGGDCDWCGIYYYGPSHEGYEPQEVEAALAKGLGSIIDRITHEIFPRLRRQQ